MIRNCELDHLEPIKFMNQGLTFFERVLRTYDKPNLIQVSPVIQDIGNDKMPDMDWIETTEIQSDLQDFS